MLKMLRHRLVLLAGFFVLCAVPKCIVAEDNPRWLVSQELLGAGKLERLWENKLPIKKPETLEQLFILGNRIYALSSHNYMVSLNREKGNVIFSETVAPAGFPVFGLKHYRDELVSIIGDSLVEINPEFGTRLSSKHFGFGITCPAARNRSYFYVAGTDRRMHVLRAEDKIRIFELGGQNNAIITSIIADDNFVVFATDAGNVISIAPDEPKPLWQFPAAGGIVGPIVRDAKSLFVASKDTNVYRLNLLTGKFVWKYQTGGLLDRGPLVTQKVVYQYVYNEGLTAIDKKNGKFMWQLQEGVDLLAEAAGKAYVITNMRTLVVMDNNKAKRLYSVNLAGVSKYVANTVDSKIYIADETGRIACLKPVE